MSATPILKARLWLVAAAALFAAGFALSAFADVESYKELKSAPTEIVTRNTAADSTDAGAAISDRIRYTNSNTTVAVSTKFSAAASDTCVVSCLLYKGTTFLGLSTSTATAGSFVDEAAASQVTAAGGRTLTFAENSPAADTLTASSGSFITDGYQAGMTLVIASSSSNNDSYKIGSVTALVITIVAADDFAAEGPLSATTTANANGYFVAPLLYFDLAGADGYEVRFAAPSAGGLDATWWAYGASSQQ